VECLGPVDRDMREVPLRPHCLARAIVVNNTLLNNLVKRFDLKNIPVCCER